MIIQQSARCVRAALMGLLAAILLMPGIVFAAPLLTTAYPGITVEPGKTVDFPLSLHGFGGGEIVNLAVTTLPGHWTAQLQGGGHLINEVYVGPGQTQSATLQLKIPKTAKPGPYRVTVAATSGSQTVHLPIAVRVSKVSASKPSLTAQYPALNGGTNTTFQFQLTLSNNGLNNQNYALSAHAPSGWQVTFSPAIGSKEIGAIPVKSGQSQTLNVSVKPAPNASTGTYRIVATASAGAGNAASVPLEVALTGTYQLAVTTPSGRLNAAATAGRVARLPLLIQNKGSAPLQNLSLTGNGPNNWTVSFSPSRVAQLPPGGQTQVILKIQPDGRAIAGDYDVSVSASNPLVQAHQDIRVTVQTSGLWGWVGVLIVLIVLGGIGYLFRRYGRR